MQHGAFSDIKLTKKQTLSPGLALPIVVVSDAECPLCKGAERSVSCGVKVKELPCTGVSRICDAELPELLLTLKV